MAEHSAIAERLSKARSKWMLSSYDTAEVREQFRHYNIVPIQSASGMRSAESDAREHGRKRTLNKEVLNQSQGGMCICRVLGIGAGVSRECFGP